jgi:hypothetical protein
MLTTRFHAFLRHGKERCERVAEGLRVLGGASLDLTGVVMKQWMNRWKPAPIAFAITFPGRFDPTENNQ